MAATLETKFGRYQVAESPMALLDTHIHDGATLLKEVDWEPKNAVLDQEDLLKQGIRVSQFIPGATDVDALGSCTANANTSALANLLDEADYLKYANASSYDDTVNLEKFAISFYHGCTDQTGDTGQEWPPTDCGSSGPYVVQWNIHNGYCGGAKIASGADNIVSLMQSGGLLVGQPFLNAWMQPDSNGFVDGNGSLSTLKAQIREGVAGGHETYVSAIEKLALHPTGHVDPSKTVLRVRNSWTKSWGDNGSYLIHLSTYIAFGANCDFRQLVAA
jgi:hypothetical protein